MNTKIYSAVLLTLLVINEASANSVRCPASVKVGTALNVTATIMNDNCSGPIAVNRTVSSLIGNPGTGTIGLQGPFVRPFTNNFITYIPKATCSSYYQITPTPHIFNIQVVSSVPTGWTGKLAAVAAGVMTTQNKLIIAGTCYVPVTN